MISRLVTFLNADLPLPTLRPIHQFCIGAASGAVLQCFTGGGVLTCIMFSFVVGLTAVSCCRESETCSTDSKCGAVLSCPFSILLIVVAAVALFNGSFRSVSFFVALVAIVIMGHCCVGVRLLFKSWRHTPSAGDSQQRTAAEFGIHAESP